MGLEILQKRNETTGKCYHTACTKTCAYCDNYSGNMTFPAAHRIKITSRGAEPSGCKGYIHCEAIPNDFGGITLIYACDGCEFGVTEKMEGM